jgi:hypothetical protein
MKTTHPLALFLGMIALTFVTAASAQNSIYVNQISTSGTTTLVQTGSSNTIGSAGTPSEITSDNVSFTMNQIGNSNAANFSFLGANLTLSSITTGNSNIQKYYVNGASNTLGLTFTGNSNTFVMNSDASPTGTTKATLTDSSVTFGVTGNNNLLKFGVSSGKYNKLDYTVAGNSNTVTSTQVGNPGGASAGTGHEQTVTITGSTNTLDISQSGVEKQTAVVNLTGSSNTVSIQQTGPGGN